MKRKKKSIAKILGASRVIKLKKIMKGPIDWLHNAIWFNSILGK